MEMTEQEILDTARKIERKRLNARREELRRIALKEKEQAQAKLKIAVTAALDLGSITDNQLDGIIVAVQDYESTLSLSYSG